MLTDTPAEHTHTYNKEVFMDWYKEPSKLWWALQSVNVFTVIDPLRFLGPVSDLPQTIKEVVCVIQTENLK